MDPSGLDIVVIDIFNEGLQDNVDSALSQIDLMLRSNELERALELQNAKNELDDAENDQQRCPDPCGDMELQQLRDNVEDAEEELRNAEEARNRFNDVVEGEDTVRIVPEDGPGGMFDPVSDTIFWDPNQYLYTDTEDGIGTGISTPVEALFHELNHFFEDGVANMPEHMTHGYDEQFDTNGERSCIGQGDELRNIQGKKDRTSHAGVPVK